MSRNNVDNEDELNKLLLTWAKEHKVKCLPSNRIYYLEQSESKAHDALSDVQATMGVCQLIKERCPDVWASSLQTASKQDVFSYIDQEKVFCVSRFWQGKEITHGLAYIAKNPSYENQVYCFDLTFDPVEIANY